MRIAKVLDLGQGIPETVTVAGPAHYAGTGPTKDEARTNVLKNCCPDRFA